MTIERWLDHHTEAALEDLAYEMNEHIEYMRAMADDFLALEKRTW